MATNTTRAANKVYVATTDATQTVLATFKPNPNRVVNVIATVLAGGTLDFSKAAAYGLEAAFRVDSTGAVTLVGSVRSLWTANETDAAWDATIDTSGGLIRVLVTGAAATNISWEADLQIMSAGTFLANGGVI